MEMDIGEMFQGKLYSDGSYISGGKKRFAKVIGEEDAEHFWMRSIHKCLQCGKYYVVDMKNEYYLELLTNHKPSSVVFSKCNICPYPVCDIEEFSMGVSGNRLTGFNHILDGGYYKLY